MAIFVLILLIFILFLFRLFLDKELDDVSPGIECEKNLLEKSDILWIIPNFDNKSISDNLEWCNRVKSYNKTLGLHGVYHTYNEFSYERYSNYLKLGIDDFEKCFGEKPTIFKAPQLELSSDNMKLIEGKGLVVYGKINQLFHKVYHCEDTGRFSNKFIDLF